MGRHRRREGPRRLYVQIYLGFLGVALVCLLVAGLAARALSEPWWGSLPRRAGALATLLVQDLPDEEPGRSEALAALGDRLDLDLALLTPDGGPVAATPGMPAPGDGTDLREGWVRPRGGRSGVRVRLADGRWVVALERGAERAEHGRVLAGVLLAVALAMALACWPIARRITRRLETLERAAEAWGGGDLRARAPVLGRDEVAGLARTFNRAADRVEALVQAQKRVLASASHELRSPLARLRMAVELLGEGPAEAARGRLLRDAVQDIEELDALVGDLLLAGRVGAGATALQHEPVALLALAREEAARAGASLDGEPVAVAGDAPALRRLVRNLLENARRHGADPIEVRVARDGDEAVLAVEDRGPGVPEADREHIFEPFYRKPGHAEGADGGVGLGLALVREIAEAHGGTARHAPRPGGGSRFEVRLPAG